MLCVCLCVSEACCLTYVIGYATSAKCNCHAKTHNSAFSASRTICQADTKTLIMLCHIFCSNFQVWWNQPEEKSLPLVHRTIL